MQRFITAMQGAFDKQAFRSFLSTLLPALLQVLPIRNRYLLTKKGRLRARYAVLPALAFFICVIIGATQVFPRGDGYTIQKHGTQSHASNLAKQQPFAAINNMRVPPMPERKASPAPIETAAPQPREKTIIVGKGDTLAGILQNAGLSGGEAYRAITAIEKHYNPRAIHPGQKIALRFDPVDPIKNDDYSFTKLSMNIDVLKTLHLQQITDGAFEARLTKKETVRRQYARKTDIQLSLYGSALKAGLPTSVITDAIHVFSWDVDFQRDIRQGDVLEVMYDQLETKDGKFVQGGDILYARLNVNGHDIPLYRFKTADGDIDYFTPSGASIRKVLMSTPVDGARLSSGFGKRRHPVLGYTKMHKGIDFAAPTGTPIYAAGDGTIERIGEWNSYGNYIRIRHNSSMKTAYAHMKKFAKNLSRGSRVKQGQVIGYIGTTGRSTGPHLHYEVLVNGVQTNPRSIKMKQGETLKGAQLTAFKNHIKKVESQHAALSDDNVKLASATNNPKKLH